jgi:hypothetical protein
MMDAQSKTMMGSWSTVLDYLQMNVAKATKPLYDVIKGGILKAAEWLGSDDASKFAEQFTEKVTKAFETASEVVSPFIDQAVELFTDLIAAGKDLGAQMEPTFRVMGAVIVIALEALARFIDLLDSAVVELALQKGICLRRLGEHDNPRCVAIQPMHDAGPQYHLPLRACPRLADTRHLRISRESPRGYRRLFGAPVPVDDKSRGLIDSDQIGVFVEYRGFHSHTVAPPYLPCRRSREANSTRIAPSSSFEKSGQSVSLKKSSL